MIFPGWEVARSIPHDVLMGLITEQDKLYRDVIRWATTTEHAEQIVRHLFALAQVGGTAELGMLEVALHEIQEVNQFWQTQGRRITKEILSSEYPEQFLASDFVDSISVVESVEWLDFAPEQPKGYIWLDACAVN